MNTVDNYNERFGNIQLFEGDFDDSENEINSFNSWYIYGTRFSPDKELTRPEQSYFGGAQTLYENNINTPYTRGHRIGEMSELYNHESHYNTQEACPDGPVIPQDFVCFNYDVWSPAQTYFYGEAPHQRKKPKFLQEEFEDSTPEQKRAIKDEIQALRNL